MKRNEQKMRFENIAIRDKHIKVYGSANIRIDKKDPLVIYLKL